MNSRKCEICDIDVHRASHVKHLRSKKLLEHEKQKEMIISERLYKEHIENNIKKIFNLKSLKQISKGNL